MYEISNYMNTQKTGIILTFGNFDGVHLGHKLAISTVKKISQETRLPSAVLTFEPHPSSVLFKKNNFKLIDQEQKANLIASHGIDYLYIINFDKGFSEISCDEFISKILVEKYNVRCIVVGKNCTFGCKQSGNISTLRKYSNMYGYSINELDPLMVGDEICSSSLIREYLQNGELNAANRLLGMPYQVSGVVTKGALRGKEIGFPTINIPIEDCMIKPKFGTYYARIAFSNYGQDWLYGVVNVGMRPTFKDLKKPIMEMHIFDFNKDLYSHKVRIQFLQFIRSEKKFHSVDELKKQINCDIIKAYELKTSL